MTHPDQWRLDQLLAWEEKRIALAEEALEELTAPGWKPPTVTDLLPPAQATPIRLSATGRRASTMTPAEMLEFARKLSREEQMHLAHDLWVEADGPYDDPAEVEAAWATEVGQRFRSDP